MLHAEKKALAMLLACGEAKPDLAVEINACMDCHEFFKKSSLLLRRQIQLRQLRQSKIVHTFIDGCCSCDDGWRWEARLTPVAQSTSFATSCTLVTSMMHVNISKRLHVVHST